MNYQFSSTKTTYKVSDIIAFLRDGTLSLSPFFQRRPVWNKGAKSFLIDSILKGFPIPIIYFREKRINMKTMQVEREVIDGQQRIRTIVSFVDPSVLKDYTATSDSFVISKAHNKEFANKAFNELDDINKERILNYNFSVEVFGNNIGDREILQMFSRINSTSYALNSQEKRNAKYFGEFKTFIYTISAEQLNRWRLWELFSESQIARMQEVEFTSELICVLEKKKIETKNNKNIDDIYSKYDVEFPEKKQIEHLFNKIMDEIEEIDRMLGKHNIFHQKTWFYALFVALFYNNCHKRDFNEFKRTIENINAKIINKSKEIPIEVQGEKAKRTTDKATRIGLINYLLFEKYDEKKSPSIS